MPYTFLIIKYICKKYYFEKFTFNTYTSFYILMFR